MPKQLRKHSIIVGIVIVLLSICILPAAYSQNRAKSKVITVKTAGHPEYTRVLISLDQTASYQIQADFAKKRIYLSLENAALATNFQNKVLRDPNLEKVEVEAVEGGVKISLHLKDANTRFMHFANENPAQIVLDLKGSKKPFIQTRIDKTKSEEIPAKVKVKQEQVKPGSMSPEEVAEAVKKATEEKQNNGWEDYEKALKTFQDKKYPEAVQALRKFMHDFPKSSYLDVVAYMVAEAEYRIAAAEKHPNFEKTTAAYLYAVRQFPNSKFQDHSLMKLTQIYSDLGYTLEAKTMIEESLQKNPDSLYTPSRHTAMATALLYDKKFEEAYTAFQKVLKESPKDDDTRKALFEIAEWYYSENEFEKTLKIYEDAEVRWPVQFSQNIQASFIMAEIYFRQKKYSQARSRYFDLINLNVDENMSNKALNRVGDSYLIEGKYMPGLAVFDESAKRKPGSHESQYGLIRMADIGIRDPSLPLRDVIFNLDPYYQPFKTYAQVFKNAVDMEILSEVTLSRALAYLQEQRYIEALEEFKKLLPLGPNSKYYQNAQKYIKQALVLLIDRFSKQTGSLPVLYTFTDYQSLALGEIDNIKTLLQIAEAYQAISMHQEAAKYFEKVKKLDTNGIYTDQIFLDLGRIHLDLKNYGEAEVVARAFLNKYGDSPRAPEAIKVLASSHRGRQQYDKAIQAYQDLLGRTKGNVADVYYQMADTYSEMKQWPEAIQLYRKTLESYDRAARVIPDFVPEAYYKLGILYYTAKDYTKALETLKTARELFPKSEFRDWNGYMVADILTRLTEKDQAATELNKVIKSDTSNDLMKKVAESKLKVMDWEKKFKEFL